MKKLIGPILILVILALGLGGMGLLIVRATADKSFGVEPDYYAKGLKWNQTAAQRKHNEQLGWTIDLRTQHAGEGAQSVIVTLTDRDGKPIEDATVRAEAFAHARSSDRTTMDFAHLASGSYAGGIKPQTFGLWQFRVVVERKSDTFTAEIDHNVDTETGGGGT